MHGLWLWLWVAGNALVAHLEVLALDGDEQRLVAGGRELQLLVRVLHHTTPGSDRNKARRVFQEEREVCKTAGTWERGGGGGRTLRSRRKSRSQSWPVPTRWPLIQMRKAWFRVQILIDAVDWLPLASSAENWPMSEARPSYAAQSTRARVNTSENARGLSPETERKPPDRRAGER